MTPHNSGDFDVIWLPKVLRILHHWAGEAASLGMSRQFDRVLRLLEIELHTDPERFGDPLYDYKQITATEYRGLVSKWFYVFYGVDRKARQVVVRGAATVAGSRLTNL